MKNIESKKEKFLSWSQTNIFFADFIIDVLILKKKKLNFAQFYKIPWDSGTHRVWVYHEKFNIDFLAQTFFLASIHV